MKKRETISLLILSLIAVGFITNSCLAVNSIVDTSNPNYATGDYKLEDIREYAIYIMKIILGLVGSLSLLAFVYGGVTFLLSAGNSKKVEDGINIIKAAVVGLLITFASVLIINLFFKGLGINWNSGTGAVPTNKAATSITTNP